MNPSEYKPEYCQLAEEYIAKGHAMESFASQVNVSRQTVYNWKEKHQEFKDALDRGFSKRQALLETMLMKCAYTGEGNVTALIFLGKNWAGLRDKFEQDLTSGGKAFPAPILPIGYVRPNNSDQEDISANQALTSAPGGDVQQ